MALEKSENQGDTNYPFDVDEAIRWLGELVDLIFVFFGPIGQVFFLTASNALVLAVTLSFELPFQC